MVLQTIRNTSVHVRLEPGTFKGPDESKGTQILITPIENNLLTAPVGCVLVVYSANSHGDLMQAKKDQVGKELALHEWTVVPPMHFYDVQNPSRSSRITFLAHVVAQDNSIFSRFTEESD